MPEGDFTREPRPGQSVRDWLTSAAPRVSAALAALRSGLKRNTLHHELTWRPVLWSVAIMLLGFLVTSFWLAYQSISDRKRLLLTFAQFAQNDLETSLQHVFFEVQDFAPRWEGFRRMTLGTEIEHSAIANRYDLLLFLDRNGTIFKAVSGHTGRQSLLSGIERQHYSAILGSESVPALNTVLAQSLPVGISVRQFVAVNRLLGRPSVPRTKDEVPAAYQFVIAVPVVSDMHTDKNGLPQGAVVAVISWVPFQRILDEIEANSVRFGLKTGYAYLTNSDGNTIIGHKLRDPKDVNLYDYRVEEDLLLPDLRRLLRDKHVVVHYYSFRGVNKCAALQPISPPDIALEDALSWRLGVGVDVPDILRAAVPTAALVFAAGLFVTVSVYMVSHLIASRASLSVRKLTELVRAASKGEFTVVSAGSTHEELSELHDAISRLILTLRADVGFVPLPNPYVVGTPIRTQDMFFGRERDLAWIGDQLRTPGNELILLAGPRRIGKTSLLHSLRRSHESMGILPFFFDTQMLMQDVHDDRSFFSVLTAGLLEQLKQRHPGMPSPQLDGYSGEPVALRKFLKYVTSRISATPVLLFDELENLHYTVENHRLSPAVFGFFAALLDSDLKVSFVVTGSDHVDRREGGPLRALFVKAMRRRLSVLAPEEAREILLNPLQGRLDYDVGMTDRILRFTGSHPYYTQDFCHRMVSGLNQLRQARVTELVVTDVITRVLDNPPPQVDYAWEQLPELARALVSGMAAAIVSPEEFVGLQNALNTLPPDYQEGLHGKRHRINNSLLTLIHHDWLEQTDQGYRFKVDMYRMWVRREHPSTQLRTFDWGRIGKGLDAEQSVS